MNFMKKIKAIRGGIEMTNLEKGMKDYIRVELEKNIK